MRDVYDWLLADCLLIRHPFTANPPLKKPLRADQSERDPRCRAVRRLLILPNVNWLSTERISRVVGIPASRLRVIHLDHASQWSYYMIFPAKRLHSYNVLDGHEFIVDEKLWTAGLAHSVCGRIFAPKQTISRYFWPPTSSVRDRRLPGFQCCVHRILVCLFFFFFQYQS